MLYHQTLRKEIITDPLDRGYSSMSDIQVAQDLNSIYRTRPFIEGHEILNATDSGEYLALTEPQKIRWERLATIPKVDMTQGVGLSLLTELFAGGVSTTFANISDLQKYSRTEELKLGKVTKKAITSIRNQ